MTPSGRSTAAALILFLALVFALVAAIVVPTVLQWSEDGQTVRASRERLATIREKQESFVRVKNASDRWSLFARAPEAGFLEATTPEETLGAASTHLSELVARHGGSLQKIELAPGEPKRGQVATVRVDMTVILPKPGLGTFLAELEDKPPYTFVSAFRATQKPGETISLALTGQLQSFAEEPL